MTEQHVVMFSGGITSWAAARRVAQRHGTSDLTLLFADTNIEDEDLYRFLDDAAKDIGVPVTRVADGRTPQDVFHDKRFLGFGAGLPVYRSGPYREGDRDRSTGPPRPVYRPLRPPRPPRPGGGLMREPVREPAPMIDPMPRLYALGFQHNNCGGGCVRGGQAQWAHLLRVFPGRYAEWEEHEHEMRTTLRADIAVLRERTGGKSRPLPLVELRQRIESHANAEPAFDADDWGGCGCFVADGGHPR